MDSGSAGTEMNDADESVGEFCLIPAKRLQLGATEHYEYILRMAVCFRTSKCDREVLLERRGNH